MIGKAKSFFGAIIRGFASVTGLDKTVANMLHGMGLFISDFCIGAVSTSLEMINYLFNHSINAIKTEVALKPTEFDAELLKTLGDLSETVVLPIAGIFVAYIFAYEIYEMVAERNRGGDMEIGNIIFLIIRTSIVILLVTHAFTIASAFSDLGYWAIEKSKTTTDSIELKVENQVTEKLIKLITPVAYDKHDYIRGDLSNPIELEDLPKPDPDNKNSVLEKYHIDYKMGPAIVVTLICIIGLFTTLLMCGVIYLIAWSRIIMILLYICIAPLPMATLLNKNWVGSIGQNYIKNLLALMLQGFLMLVIVVIYNGLLTRTATLMATELSNETQLLSPIKALLLMFVSMSIVIRMLMSTHSLAKSITGAS